MVVIFVLENVDITSMSCDGGGFGSGQVLGRISVLGGRRWLRTMKILPDSKYSTRPVLESSQHLYGVVLNIETQSSAKEP